MLTGKIGLITGAGSGIGRECALAMSRAGADGVIVSDIVAHKAEETAHLVTESGGRAIALAADVSQSDQVARMVELGLRHFGRLDCAVNNAGIGGQMSALHEKDEAEWDQVIAVNLKGVWLCMRSEIPAMLENGGGSIVNVASVAGLIGFRKAAAYSASKHGVIGLTRTGALEYARRNIRVNAVCPYFTDTPMVQSMIEAAPVMQEATLSASPMKRLGDVAETAAAVVWLCSDAASYVTGHALPVDGGVTAG